MSDLHTDRALLARFRAGEPEVLRALYWEYVRKVERLLMGGFVGRDGSRTAGVVKHPDDLADLVQEVFLRVFSEKGRCAYDGQRDFAPYLYTIARNALVEWARTKGREIPAPSSELEAALDTSPLQESPSPWEVPATMRVVEHYLSNLQGQLREVYHHRHEVCLSQEEAARRIGVSRQTLRTLERRLEDGLAEALEAAGIDGCSQPELLPVRGEPMKVERHET